MLFNLLYDNSYLKPIFNWKLAICQHPMYLLIDEDRGEPIVGERVPPWGAPDAATYVERVKRNLLSLERHNTLKLNYQFSAVELESMVNNFPEMKPLITEAYHRKKLDFIGGTYSQPHSQVIGSESNWRQIEYGLAVYKKLLNKEVKTYFRQETGLHVQLPQILKQFGYEMMVVPPFPWAMEIIDGRFEVTGLFHGLDTIQDDEFVNAVALDGSSLPVYLKVLDGEHNKRIDDYTLFELNKGQPSGPPIWTLFPDMEEITDERFYKVDKLFDFVFVEDVLSQRVQESPPRASALLYTHWSYAEGVWAEALLRSNKRAEEEAVLAEMIQTMGVLGNCAVQQEDMRKTWQTILKYQHHDVAWIEVTDLRRKAINHYEDCITSCRRVMQETTEKFISADEESMVIFNGLPTPRRMLVELDKHLETASGDGFQKVGDHYVGVVDLPAGGYTSYPISRKPLQEGSMKHVPDSLELKNYCVVFDDCGLMKQLRGLDGADMLRTSRYLGGEIRAMVNDNWVDNRTAECEFYSGHVADILIRKVVLGEIPVIEKYQFYHDIPFIKVDVSFDFKNDTVGNFWIDDTKINVYYPTGGGEIHHDIPFGYVTARENRTLFATNWLHCGGLLFVNRGTVKHMVQNGVIRNLLAWGGKAFNNRQHEKKYKSYDISLQGKETVTYYISPYGAFDGKQVVKTITDLVFPIYYREGIGEESMYIIDDDSLAVTSIFRKADDTIWVRGYQLPMENTGLYNDWEIFNTELDKLNSIT